MLFIFNRYVESVLLTAVAVYSSIQLALQMDSALLPFLPRLVIFGCLLVFSIHLMWPPTDYYTSDLQYSALFVLLQMFFMSAYMFSEPFMLIPVLLITATMYAVSVQHAAKPSSQKYKYILLPIFLVTVSLLFVWDEPKIDELCLSIVSYMVPKHHQLDSRLPSGGFISDSRLLDYGYLPLLLIAGLYTGGILKLGTQLRVGN